MTAHHGNWLGGLLPAGGGVRTGLFEGAVGIALAAGKPGPEGLGDPLGVALGLRGGGL